MPKIFSTEDLISFAEDLRVDGYNIATQQYVAAQEVLVILAANARLPADPRELKTWLAPILCSSPKEQDTFYQQFERWLDRHGFVPSSDQPSAPPQRREQTRAPGERLTEALRWLRLPRRLLAAAVIFVAFMLLIWSLWLGSHILSGEVVDEVGKPVEGALVSFARRSTKSDEEGRFSLNPSQSDFPNALSVEHPDYMTARSDKQTAPTEYIRVTLRRRPTPSQSTIYPRELTIPRSTITVMPPPQSAASRWVPWLVPLAPLLVLVAWLIWRARRRIFLENVPSDERPLLERMVIRNVSEQLFQSASLRHTLQGLRRHRRLEAPELDSRQTVEATIARGGLYTPVAGMRAVSPEYLVLIDRAGFQDQQARLEDELVKRLREESVFVDRYYFSSDPRLCRDDLHPNRYLRLADLAALHHEHYLLIFSDGSSFINPLTGAPEPWVEMLSAWRGRALLTPERAAHWGYREATLIDQDILVLPLDHEGVARLAESVVSNNVPAPRHSAAHAPPCPELLQRDPRRWLERHKPRPGVVRKLREQLRAYLGDEGYAWLCACAVYPLPQWELTLYLGRSLFGEREGSEERLLALVRLPWFRQGSMPDWLRSSLIDDLAPGRERDVRRALKNLFISLIERPTEGIVIDFSRREGTRPRGLAALIHGLKRWARRLNHGGLQRALLHSERPDGPLRDHLFLSFMSGRHPGHLTVSLPRALRRLLFPHGHSILGLRPAAACALAGVLAFAGWYWVVRELARPVPTEVAPYDKRVSINVTLITSEYVWMLGRIDAAYGFGKTYPLSDLVNSLERELSTAEAIVCVGMASGDGGISFNTELAEARMRALASQVSRVSPDARIYGLNLGTYRRDTLPASDYQRRVIILAIKRVGSEADSKASLEDALHIALDTYPIVSVGSYSHFELTVLR